MLDQTAITDVLSVVPVASLTPVDFVDIPYTSALLLNACLPAALIADPGFVDACESGFDAYFDGMVQGDTLENHLFVNRFYTREEVLEAVVVWVVEDVTRGERLVWAVGFTLGWLSALALTDRPLAFVGLQMLVTLVCRS